MGKSFKKPGVYIKEITKLPPSIAQVETAIPAFIGYTEKLQNGAQKNSPKRIRSILEYEHFFGKSLAEVFELKITTTIQSGVTATVAVVLNSGVPENEDLIPTYLMYYGLRLFFTNGGGSCYIVSCGLQNDNRMIAKEDVKTAVDVLDHQDEVTLITSPDATRLDDFDYTSNFANPVLKQCLKLRDRFGVFDVIGAYNINNAKNDVQSFRNNISSIPGEIKYGAAYLPYLQTAINLIFDESQVTIKNHVEINDGTTSSAPGYLVGKALNDPLVLSNKSVYQAIIKYLKRLYAVMPPASAIAGIYAQTDSKRGVWKAPANLSLSNVISPAFKISSHFNASLNVDNLTGKSINAIRAFAGRGTLVWGARTLAGNDNEWRYVSVVRFFNMVEESVKKTIVGFVFEPNDNSLWTKVKSVINNFLTTLWRNGAMAGSKSDDAFYVKVGLGETMTTNDIRNNKMIIEIGMAVVRPAEFVIFRIIQNMNVR